MFSKIIKSPPLLVIKMPDICQLHCRYCFREYKKQPELLNYRPEQVGDLLKYYREIKQLSFLGGESLIFLDKVKAIIEATKFQINKYTITTNGLLLSENTVQYLYDNHVQLNVSLDGRKEINDFNRGKGTFDKIMIGINNIRKVCPPDYFWVISSTFSKETIHSLYDTYLFIKNEIRPRGWATNIDKYGDWSQEDLQIIKEQLLLIKKDYLQSDKKMKWFLGRIFEEQVIYNHCDHLILHQNGTIYQGFPFSKEILYSKDPEKNILGDINHLSDLKVWRRIIDTHQRPCHCSNCNNCPISDRTPYMEVKDSHAILLCCIYQSLLNIDDKNGGWQLWT